MPIDPGWLSLLPPLAAIILALAFREVVISLFAGVWLGAFFLSGYNPVTATATSVDRFVREALADPDHAAIIMFSLLLGGMVGVMARSGGTQGIVEALRPLATTPRRAQFLTWLAGMLIFFDDYANTLIVGNSMRPVTDRLRVSREKLSYVVDSTAAPIAAIALSTWIGFEISLIGDSLETAAMQATDPAVRADLLLASESPVTVFLHSIPYLFYPILALLFVLMVVLTRRDFGPMRTAETRAGSGGGLYRPGAMLATDTSGGIMEPPEGTPHRWYNAAIPVALVVLTALVGIVVTGQDSLGPGQHSLREIVGAADPFDSLIWGSFIGSAVAIILVVGQRLLTLQQAMEAWIGGMRAMLLAVIILVLAWSLGGVTEALGTGPYLSSVLSETLPVEVMPVLVFLIAGATSFATGTSWGTMAILFPVEIGRAHV